MRSSSNWRLLSMTVAAHVFYPQRQPRQPLTVPETPPQAGDRKEAALKMLIMGMPQLEWTCASLHEILGRALNHGGASDLYY